MTLPFCCLARSTVTSYQGDNRLAFQSFLLKRVFTFKGQIFDFLMVKFQPLCEADRKDLNVSCLSGSLDYTKWDSVGEIMDSRL